MRNSELGRVIAGLSLVILLTIAILVAVVVDMNWGGRGLITVATACTPTPTPTPTQTPQPCDCVSDDASALTLQAGTIVLQIPKQETASDGWKGAIQSLISVEDWDWVWDMWYWEWWPEMEYTYKWTFSPEVNVTQAGTYNVTVTVDDFPLTFICPHYNEISCFDDDSKSCQATVIVYSVQTQITGFSAGSSPYDATPIISSFITNSETECSVNATATENPAIDNNVNWTIDPPSGWSCANSGGSLTYSQTATVPTHPDGGRSGWTITLKAKHPTGEETSVSASQSSTDRIRQMYVDHGIDVPGRDEFSGAEMTMKSNAVSGRNGCAGCYASIKGGSLPISCSYRNPEHNEDVGGVLASEHQYAVAYDHSPMEDLNQNSSKVDEAEWVVDHAKNHHSAGYAYQKYSGNMVHMDWR